MKSWLKWISNEKAVSLTFSPRIIMWRLSNCTSTLASCRCNEMKLELGPFHKQKHPRTEHTTLCGFSVSTQQKYLVDQVVGSTSWSKSNHFPEVHDHLVSLRSLQYNNLSTSVGNPNFVGQNLVFKRKTKELEIWQAGGHLQFFLLATL